MKASVWVRHLTQPGLVVGLLWYAATSVGATVNPSSVIVTILEMRASTNADCTSAATIFKPASPTAVDLAAADTTLGSGIIVDGTYHCFMIHLKDVVTIVPAATENSCVAGTPYTLDFFKNPVYASINPDTGLQIKSTAGEDDPWIYFNDHTDAVSGNNCYDPTINCECGAPCPLPAAAKSVAADVTRTLVVNFNGKLDGSGASCTITDPKFEIQ